MTTSIAEDHLEEVLQEVNSKTRASGALTPRSGDVIEAMYRRGLLYLAFVDEKLAGWVLSEPIGRNIFELGMTFVKPEFRSQPVFRELAAAAIKPTNAYIIASYSDKLIRFVEREHAFKRTSLSRVILRTKGRFLTKRLGKHQRHSISARLKTKDPLFAIREIVNYDR